MLFDDTARSSSCPLLLSFLFNVNIIPATLSSSELAVVVPGWGWVIVQVIGGKFRYRICHSQSCLAETVSSRFILIQCGFKSRISDWWERDLADSRFNSAIPHHQKNNPRRLNIVLHVA